MGLQKLVLDELFDEDYSLVAIHCSEEAYKLAFLINKHVGLRLQRMRIDLDYSVDGLEVTYPLFQFDNKSQYTTYYLVSNKCKSQVAQLNSAGGLFDSQETSKTVVNYLIPEFKKVDYFLKIESDAPLMPLRKTIALLNEIKEVISSYSIETEKIKSKKNLIFH